MYNLFIYERTDVPVTVAITKNTSEINQLEWETAKITGKFQMDIMCYEEEKIHIYIYAGVLYIGMVRGLVAYSFYLFPSSLYYVPSFCPPGSIKRTSVSSNGNIPYPNALLRNRHFYTF